MHTRAATSRAANVPDWVHALASRKLTVLSFVLTAAGSLAVAQGGLQPTAPMLAPFVLLTINIGAAVFASARFRADLPLLLFHLCLLALLVLVSIARLVYMEGQATISSGTAFDGTLESRESGLLHRGRLHELQFANEGFTENYFRRGKFRATYNRVRWQDDYGHWHSAEIGNSTPLVLHGYRIYTSSNRGFSPVFHWQPLNGEGEYGTVQLTDRLPDSMAPAMNWTLPGGVPARVILDIEQPKEGKVRPGLDSKDLPHALVLQVRDIKRTLQPGENVALPEGTLTYVRLDSWMGYQISYDPTKPWIMATVLIGIISLIWFYWRRIW